MKTNGQRPQYFLIFVFSLSSLVVSLGSVVFSAQAEEPSKKPAATAAVPAQKVPQPPPAPIPTASEAAQKWKALRAQEEWVARLKKQIQGETNQLNEMRLALAQAFKLDVKKLEEGLYDFDEKNSKFIEKKPSPSTSNPR